MGSATETWSYKAGEKGRNRVRVYEDNRTGIILAEFYEDEKRKRVSLGHRNRTKAKQLADNIAAAIGKAEETSPPVHVTLRELFDNYLSERTPDKKSEETRRHDRMCADMFLSFFGSESKAKTLSRLDWDRFVRERREGRVGPSGRKVSNRTIEYDLKWLRAVFNWATMVGDGNGGVLLERNPLTGLPLPKETSPRRPIMTQERYEAMLRVAEGIDWRFKLALVLANETGNRIGAIRQLRSSDIDLKRGLVHWRAETDKIGFARETPLTEAAIAALVEALEGRPVIGIAWVLPAPKDASKPCSKNLMKNWWKKAEALADVEHIPGLGWHGFRRKFGTELKNAPPRDVRELGGWKSFATPLQYYQQSDEESMREALKTRRTLRSASGD
jgi:integrase